MKTYPQYKPYEFIPILEIRKMNEEGKTNTNDNYNTNNNNFFNPVIKVLNETPLGK